MPTVQGTIHTAHLGHRDALQAGLALAPAAYAAPAGRTSRQTAPDALLNFLQPSGGGAAAPTGHARSAPLLLAQQQQAELLHALQLVRASESQPQPSLIMQPQQQVNLLEASTILHQMTLQQQAAEVWPVSAGADAAAAALTLFPGDSRHLLLQIPQQ